MTAFPDPTDATQIAPIDLAAGPTSASQLYRAIPRRHTNRYPCALGRSVADATLAGFEALTSGPLVCVIWFTGASDRQRMGEQMKQAAEAFVAHSALNRDANRRYRAIWQDVQRCRDSIPVHAAGRPDLTRTLGKMLVARHEAAPRTASRSPTIPMPSGQGQHL